MNDEQLIEHLKGLPIERFVDVLRQVFAAKPPAPEEAAYCPNHFYLGIASRDLESDEDEPQRWGAWRFEAVAYVDPAEWGDSHGPDYGLAQAGTCATCGTHVCSNVKQGLCPICGARVYMT